MKLNDISEHKRKQMVLKIKENDVRVFKINGVENDVNEHYDGFGPYERN